MNDNPFLQVYTAIWSLLEGRAGLTDKVKLGNRIRFDNAKDRDPLKGNVAVSDMPELILASFGGTPNTHSTSTNASILRNYQVMLSTGDYRLTEGLYDVEFEVFSAFSEWYPLLRNLTWKGKRFVTLAQLTDLSEGFADGEANRGLAGWSSIWTGQVRFDFTLSDLRE